MDERREALLKKVRALLAKADDRAVTQAEADAFREKADELMVRYAVEEYELRTTSELKPAARHVTTSWWYAIDQDSYGQSATGLLFDSVYRHCRCSIIFKEQDRSAETIAVVGYESDLDYADLLFTSLLLQLARATSPRPDPTLSYEENLERMFLAGVPWPEIAERMIGVGMFWDGYEGGWARPVIERKLIHDYLTWADAAGREVPAFDRDDYRESFGRGFIEQICDRLEAMRARSASQETVSGTRFELVTRDIEQRVSSAALELFPDAAPHAADCRCNECSRDRRTENVGSTGTFDFEAYGEGLEAGQRAEIFGRADSRLGGSQRAITEG